METNAKLKGKRKMLDAWWKIYRQMVRTLIYLIISRLDIAYDVSIFNKFMQALKHAHMVAIKEIFWYIKDMINFGLIYTNNKFSLELHCDVDWAWDKASRKSTSGMRVFIWLCNIIMDVKETINNCFKHKLIYRATTQITCEVVWMEMMLNELGVNR